MFFYKTVTVKDIYPMLKEAVLTTGNAITFLLATSSMMSFAMAFTGIPAISAAILGLTTNKSLILLLVNVVLLIVGMFMDVGPAIPIFTPIFLPVITSVGVDPVHFGLFSIMNLCVGSITPPVGTGLAVGASVGGVKAEQMLAARTVLLGDPGCAVPHHVLPCIGDVVAEHGGVTRYA